MTGRNLCNEPVPFLRSHGSGPHREPLQEVTELMLLARPHDHAHRDAFAGNVGDALEHLSILEKLQIESEDDSLGCIHLWNSWSRLRGGMPPPRPRLAARASRLGAIDWLRGVGGSAVTEV